MKALAFLGAFLLAFGVSTVSVTAQSIERSAVYVSTKGGIVHTNLNDASTGVAGGVALGYNAVLSPEIILQIEADFTAGADSEPVFKFQSYGLNTRIAFRTNPVVAPFIGVGSGTIRGERKSCGFTCFVFEDTTNYYAGNAGVIFSPESTRGRYVLEYRIFRASEFDVSASLVTLGLQFPF